MDAAIKSFSSTGFLIGYRILKMKNNLGETSLRVKRYNRKSMQIFDELPGELRNWLSKANLPWSPISANRIWEKLRKRGLNAREAIAFLSKAEEKTLSKDRYFNLSQK